MKPIDFDQATYLLAATQPEYQPLPVHVGVNDPACPMTSCWQLSAEELEQLQANGGRIYVQQLTFGQAFQPQLLSLEAPQ